MIGSLLSRMNDAEKLSPNQLQQTVKDGVLPEGIANLVNQTKPKATPQMPNQGSTVADEVMSEVDRSMSPEDKIKQKIDTLKQEINEIHQGVQSGEVKPYLGIPLLKEKVQELSQLESMMQQAMEQVPMGQPPMGQPQMGQAPMDNMMQAPQGIDAAQSNLPTQMAKGGIASFADGGDTDEDYEDQQADEDYERGMSMIGNPSGEMVLPAAIMSRSRSSKPETTSGKNTKQGSSTFDAAMKFVLPHEGGFVNHPSDKGGPTNRGVTQSTLSGYLGRKASIEDVKNLDENTAKDIYKSKFWDPIVSKVSDPKAQLVAFNAAIASGPSYAKSLIEKHGADPYKMLGEHTKYMVEDIPKKNPSQQVFVKGWGNRQRDLGNYIQNFASGGIAQLASGGEVPRYSGSTKYGSQVSDEFRSGYDRIFGGDKLLDDEKTKTPYTTEEILKNLEEGKKSKTKAPEAPSSRVLNFSNPLPIAPPSRNSYYSGISDLPKNKMTLKEALSPFKKYGASTDANVYPGISDLNYYNELKTELEKDPSYQPYKDEMANLLKRNPQLLGKNQNVSQSMTDEDYARFKAMNDAENLRNQKLSPTSRNYNYQNDLASESKVNPIVVKKPTAVNPSVNSSDSQSVTSPTTSTEKTLMGPPADLMGEPQENKGIASIRSPYQDQIDRMMAQYQDIKQQKEEDKYMSLLAAGLGMMGGTSPYAGANIGQGALAGVQNYAQAARSRAAEQAALNKNLANVARFQEMGNLSKADALQRAQYQKDMLRYHYDSLGQTKEEKDRNFDLETKRIDAYIANLTGESARHQITDKNLNISRARDDFRQLQKDFTQSLENKYIKQNPNWQFDPKLKQRYAEEFDAFTKSPEYNTLRKDAGYSALPFEGFFGKEIKPK